MGTQRIIDLEGCLNFRDLGGYATRLGRRVRKGKLFRSDALHRMTPGDVAIVRDSIGVADVIDLRSSTEVEIDGIGPLPEPPVRYHHAPLFDGGAADAKAEIPQDLGHQYFLLLHAAERKIAQIIEILIGSPDPAVFHCAAGKDRTGVVSAVILALLGVEDADIVEDYVFTSRNLDRIIARLRETESYRSVFEKLPPSTLHAEPETMSGFLSRVRRSYGSMHGFAESARIGPETLTRLESWLLEDPAG